MEGGSLQVPPSQGLVVSQAAGEVGCAGSEVCYCYPSVQEIWKSAESGRKQWQMGENCKS